MAARPVLLDGGMGRELQFRGVNLSKRIGSAQGLVTAPGVVRQIHADYIAAGADIITTNTYGLIRDDLARAGWADRFAELNQLACRLARDAVGKARRSVRIARSLPPLRGSFRPDLVGPRAEIIPCYREQARLLAPHMDLLLCETMSSGAEARAAAEAACETGKPVWVSWSLHEDESGRLRSGISIGRSARLRIARQLLLSQKRDPGHTVPGRRHDHCPAHRRICQYLSPDSSKLVIGWRQGHRWSSLLARGFGAGRLCRPCDPMDSRWGHSNRWLLRHTACAYPEATQPAAADLNVGGFNNKLGENQHLYCIPEQRQKNVPKT